VRVRYGEVRSGEGPYGACGFHGINTVRSGLVGCGPVRLGQVGSGLVRAPMGQPSFKKSVRYGLVWRGMARSGMAWWGVVGWGEGPYGATWFNAINRNTYGPAWQGSVRLGRAR
jgi:hypothetical protein